MDTSIIEHMLATVEKRATKAAKLFALREVLVVVQAKIDEIEKS